MENFLLSPRAKTSLAIATMMIATKS